MTILQAFTSHGLNLWSEIRAEEMNISQYEIYLLPWSINILKNNETNVMTMEVNFWELGYIYMHLSKVLFDSFFVIARYM